MLFKKLIRTMGQYKAQFISMIVMIALGFGVFIGFNMEWSTIEKNTDRLFEETGLADYKIYSSSALSDNSSVSLVAASFSSEELEKIENIDGVKAASRFLSVNADVSQVNGETLKTTAETKKTSRVALTVTENKEVSFFNVTRGEEYDEAATDKIWLSDKYAESNDIKIGDLVTLSSIKGFSSPLTFRVAGLAKSGEYMICVQGESQLMPDYTTFGFAYISPAAYKKAGEAAGLPYEIYPQINVRVNDYGRFTKKDFSAAVNAALDKTTLVLSKDESSSYALAHGEVQEGQTMGAILPVLFLAIAVLTMVTTMHRIAAKEKTQIGTLKALGYTDREIQKKYLIYSLSATVLGSGLGLAVGFKLFPTVIYDAYCIMYDLPPVEAPFHWGVAAICVVVALGCVTLVTCNVCHGVLSEMPANIMRPKAPPAGQRVLLEKVPFIWRRLSFSHKVTVRNLFRYKKRVLMTIVGIAGCAALVLTGYGLKDAINDIVQNQFQKVFRYDLLAGYSAEDEAEEQALFDQLESDPDIKEWMPQYRAAITAVDERHSYEVNLTVSQDYTRLTDFISLQERVSRRVLTPEKEGAIITEKLGTMLGLKAGDTLTLRDGDNRTYELAIAGVSENYASHFVYISAEYYEEVFGKAPEYNTVIVDLADRDDWAAASEKLLAGGTVQMISSDEELVEQYKNVTDNLGYVVAVLIVSAGLLAFVVQYNLSNINITERTREIATLKVLGFYDGEVSAYIYRESVILTILGTGLGLLLGTALTRFVVATAEVDSIMFGRSIYWPSFLMAALITFLFSFLVNWVMHYRLKKINMVESMKSVD